MFEQILVPVDLTAKNWRAVEAARDLAGLTGGEITLLHVIEPLDLPFEELADFYEELEGRAAEQLRKLAGPLRDAGLKAQQHVIYGDRARQIVEYARENGFQIVILSSHRADLENPARDLATISHKVAVLAQTPVLLVK